MRNIELMMHNEFVDVVSTFLLCFEPMNVELIFPPMFMNLY